jgi:hypothetical protein
MTYTYRTPYDDEWPAEDQGDMIDRAWDAYKDNLIELENNE